MSEYVIRGGSGFSGSVRISGNKNAALPCLAASLLTDESVTLRNVPMIQDVGVMVRLLGELGSEVIGLADGTYHIRSDIRFNMMSLLDIWYAHNRTWILDVRIVIRTAWTVLFSRGAY